MNQVVPDQSITNIRSVVNPPLNTQLPLFSDSVIHHNVSPQRHNKMIVSYKMYGDKRYGVSSSRRVLSPQLLLKKFDYVRDCLVYCIGLTSAQTFVTLRLLRLWAYYGYVYPKEAQITAEPGCSKATFWRAIRHLSELGVINVVNRYVIRPHAQISNLYRLDKLILAIAKYLAEHIAHVWPDWIHTYILTPWPSFWRLLDTGQLKLPYPGAGSDAVV